MRNLNKLLPWILGVLTITVVVLFFKSCDKPSVKLEEFSKLQKDVIESKIKTDLALFNDSIRQLQYLFLNKKIKTQEELIATQFDIIKENHKTDKNEKQKTKDIPDTKLSAYVDSVLRADGIRQ